MPDEPSHVPAPTLTLCQRIKHLLEYHRACVAHFKGDDVKRERHERHVKTCEEVHAKLCKKERAVKEPKPTLPEVLLYASEVELPEAEARKFFQHFEANGWKMTGRTKVANWRARLDLWREHWIERRGQNKGRGGARRTDFTNGF